MNEIQPFFKEPKKRVKADYTLNDIYKFYVSKVDEKLRHKERLFNKFIKELNKELINKVLDNSETIKLSGNLGKVRIKKQKMSFLDASTLRIDWKRTKESNVKVYHLNEHRNGYRYRFYWVKNPMVNISYYSFVPTRANKRRLSNILTTKPEIDYYE